MDLIANVVFRHGSTSRVPSTPVTLPSRVDPRRWPTTLTLVPTYRCSAECANCCFASNPRIGERAPQPQLLATIDEAVVAFPLLAWLVVSGGEPFLLGDDLVELVAAGQDHGLETRVISNGYWASTAERARKRLGPLVEAGLDHLVISSGDEHARFVPEHRVVMALAAAIDLGLRCSLAVESTGQARVTADLFVTDPVLRDALDRCRRPGAFEVLTSPWMQIFDGPVMSPPDTAAIADIAATSEDERGSSGCPVVLRTLSVGPEGRLGLCDGLIQPQVPELRGSPISDGPLGETFAADAKALLPLWLMVDGPRGILAWAAGHDPAIEWEGRYAHDCDACRAVFTDPAVRRVLNERVEAAAASLGDRIGPAP